MSSSCSESNTKLVGVNSVSTFICLSCGEEKPLKKNSAGKYCNNRCQHDYQIAQRFKLVEQGLGPAGQVKNYLLAKHGNTCSECGITDWNGKSIVMELEHRNGNSDDNTLGNCCLLCPNCHSQTPTYKNRNKGNGRAERRVRYQAGLSY